MIMTLVDMGFELEDSQAAIENGKFTVQQAIDWILNGKPKVPAAPPTLKLSQVNANDASASASYPKPTAAQQAVAMDTEAPVAMDTDPSADDSQLTSRLHLSDEQRQIKLNFERKQLDEAKRKAIEDKAQRRKAHADTLRQIQEDKDRRKNREAVSAPVDDAQQRATVPQAVSGASAVAGVASGGADVSIIQIRLLNGQTVKQSFPADDLLDDVRRFVQEKSNNAANIALIQPFPRVEYSDEQLQRSLRSLGLVPTGSLVVKKTEASANSSVQSGAAVQPVAAPVVQSAINPLVIAPPIPPVIAPPIAGGPAHHWGGGQSLNPHAQQEDDEMNIEADDDIGHQVAHHNDDAIDDDSDDDNVGGGMPVHPGGVGGIGGHPGWGAGGGFGQGGFGQGGFQNPIFGGGMGQGPPMHGIHHGQGHVWGGTGYKLSGDMLPNVDLPHRQQDPKQLAAEAASKRSGVAPPEVSPSVSDIALFVEVQPLLTLVLHYVSTHICSTRHPIVGLQGIPTDLAAKVLQNLIREGLLSPKTIQPFRTCHLRKIVLDCYPYCTNELLHALRHHIYMTHISLASCPLITDKGLQHLSGLKSLKVLNLSGCEQINNACVPVIIALQSLTTVNLENTKVTDAGIIEYASSAPPNLQDLNVSRTDVTQAAILSLQAIPHLRRLNLEQTKITGLSGIQNVASLTELNIARTQIVTDSLLCLKDHPTLKYLNIASTMNVNGDMALQYLAGLKLIRLELPDRNTTTDRGLRYLTGLPLEVLDLTNYIHTTDASMESIGQITTLHTLRLSNTKITNAGMIFLAGLKNLEELFLDRTDVSNVGASIIKEFTRLRELSLSSSDITNGLLTSGTLNSCAELTKLNLSRNKISEKGLKHLQLPHLTLLNIDNTFVKPGSIDSLPQCPRLTRVIFSTFRQLPEDEEDSLN